MDKNMWAMVKRFARAQLWTKGRVLTFFQCKL